MSYQTFSRDKSEILYKTNYLPIIILGIRQKILDVIIRNFILGTFPRTITRKTAQKFP